MVQAMLEGLASNPAFELFHVNFRLSRDNADIGRWRPAKFLRTLGFALQAIAVRLRHGCDTLYYVPSPPGKRGALYRDWLVLLLCRPFFSRLVLHWHAVGLAQWLETEAHGWERVVTRALLGRADLAIVLSDALRHDATALGARQTAVVPNGIVDPRPPPRAPGDAIFQALFLGLCSEEKGLFAAAEAVLAANRSGSVRFRLVAAGAFPDEATKTRFEALAKAHPDLIAHAGFVTGAEKTRLLSTSHCLIFPTHYPAEGLPLVALEALAYDLPIVATRWRALPDIVTPDCGQLVPPHDLESLIQALLEVRRAPPRAGACRARFLQAFELSRHLERLRAALRIVAPPT